MEKSLLFDDSNNIRKNGDMIKKVFTNDILFIPEYIYNAINSSGVTIEQYIDTIKAAKTSPGFKSMYDIFYTESEELKTYAQTLLGYNQTIYKTIGSEINNLVQIQKYISSELGVSHFEESDIEFTFIRGLKNISNNKYNRDLSPINLLKLNSNIKFEETYDIVSSDICMVILKDGFGNYIDEYQFKKRLLDDIINSRQVFMGNMVFGSYFVKSSIRLNLSN